MKQKAGCITIALINAFLIGCLGIEKTYVIGNAAEVQKEVPTYRIYPLRNGLCKVRGDHAFEGGDPEKIYNFALYIWLILGGEKPMLIDAGINDVAEMNRGASEVLYEPITQTPEESSRAQLARFGLTPEDIGHVFITHLHFDHVDELFNYTYAAIHVGRKEWTLATANDCRGSWGHGPVMFRLRDDPKWNARLHLLDDEEVMPGLESFWLGGHTPGSMAYRIRTERGWAVCTGDTISLAENMERPVGVYRNLDEVGPAMKKVRDKADVVLPSHDPDVHLYWPQPKGAPRYSIRAVKVGQCEVIDGITFQDRFHDQTTRTYYLYVWVIEGGEKPMIVDTGPNPKYLENFNKATAQYIPGGVKHTHDENTLVALKKIGIDPADVSHVIVTHAHGDHYDYFPAFPNAKMVINRTELEQHRNEGDSDHPYKGFPEDVVKALQRPNSLMVVEDEEIVPGVRAVPLGCHTDGSQGVLVQTWAGPVLLTGDVVYTYDNIEQNRPGRSPNPDACLEAMAKIRLRADIILPAHDPLTLKRWPGGIIGAPPRR